MIEQARSTTGPATDQPPGSTFDHRDSGTAESAWRLPALDPLSIPARGDRLVVVAAHPDDETLGAGGLIAAAHRNNVLITVVVATDGEASHPHSPTHSAGQLATIRRSEVQAAVETLAPEAVVHFLGLPDGRLDVHHDALTAQIEYFARTATHLVSPWSGDRHPDHEACARASAEVAGRHNSLHWQYPIWAWHWATPDEDFPFPGLHGLPLSAAELDTKTRALQSHVSQHAPLSDAPGDEAILSPGMLAHFARPIECFVVVERRDASSPGYFDDLYAQADDPWDLQGRFYEQRKRALQLAVLPRARFRRAFEPGCATGLLTEQLAERCDEVVAWDVASRALQQAIARLTPSAAGRLRVERGRIPDDWPDGNFDLIVLSEVGYYCVDLAQLVKRVDSTLTDDGVLLACHWRHPASDHPQTAESVHEALGAQLHPLVAHVEDDFLLHVWARSAVSVAASDGIVP